MSIITVPCCIQGACYDNACLVTAQNHLTWDALRDSLLSDFIRHAAASNLDLKLAHMHIIEASESGASKRMIEDLEDDYRATWIAISADVARTHLELRSLQLRLEVIKKSMNAQKMMVNLSKDLLARGIVDAFSLHLLEEDYERLLAKKSQLQSAIDKGVYHMAELLDGNACNVFTSLEVVCPLPNFPFDSRTKVTENLLLKRPDVRKANRNLVNACRKTQRMIASYEYRQTFQKALEEAESALLSLQEEESRNHSLKKVHEVALSSFQLTEDLVRRGLSDHFELATKLLALLSAEDTLLQSDVELLFRYIALHQAMGQSA